MTNQEMHFTMKKFTHTVIKRRAVKNKMRVPQNRGPFLINEGTFEKK